MGELHLEIIVDRLIREFRVEATVGKPQVAYKESIVRPVTYECRYVRQTGGHGQYAHTVIEFAPLDDPEEGETFRFVNKIVGGVIPKEFIPAVDQGIRDALMSGPLGGYELINLKATLKDGSFHEVDSSDLAFRIAGSLSVKEGITKDNCELLEPMMSVEVLVPDEYLGDIVGNLTSRRCKISGMETRQGSTAVNAICPLSEMFGYATDLRSRTQGRGTFTMQFNRYDKVSAAIQEQILGKYNYWF
jgi:elongation factor G